MAAADAAVTHHHDPVRDREDLTEAVRHKDNGDSPGLERPHAVEETERLIFGEGRGRLVENEKPRPFGQRTGDDDQLLGSKVERRHRRPGVDLQSEVGKRRRGDAVLFTDIENAPSRRFVVQCQIGCHAHVADDVDFLRNQRNARRLGRRNPGRGVGLAAKGNGSVIASRRMRAGKDLDERRFPCAVLTEKGHDLAWCDGKIDPVESTDPRELLGEAGRHQERAGRPAIAAGRRLPLLASGHGRLAGRHGVPLTSGRSVSCRARSCRPRRYSASRDACRRSRPSGPG